jgi:maleylpyruvate isomerase
MTATTGDTAMAMRLYDYWRSSAAYRVRIALNLKGLAYEQQSVDLRAGAQRDPAYLEHNPQGLVPHLIDGEIGISQSLAIIAHLDEQHPEPPLLPQEPGARARVRALALTIACEIHPLNNLRVLQHLGRTLAADEGARQAWYRHWVALGFQAIETDLGETAGFFACGDQPTLADVVLVPQVYNARRYDCDLGPYPLLRRVDAHCQGQEAFARAAPERQPDAQA